ncbi:SM-ATX domain-containing protein [Cephalotus follicularis]|uniref:SM-ATX domain-containing protein n=1 Tax=Cephalotus follicularis TaxID=3775 RepID=A0A1Q3BY52_CEPFO|nr:SM-ATX domain-containing protein [Cephalotus follicularis]
MGYQKNRVVEEETTHSSTTSPLSEALLFATMFIIGLPVDVHIKDGSVYSGIFYTASVDKEYGIVLKKARMTKKGKNIANVANGEVIETLVILSDDLVQVIAKGVLLPVDGVAGNIAGYKGEAAVSTIASSDHSVNGAKNSLKSSINIQGINQKSRQNENGFAHGSMPAIDGKEHEGIKVPATYVTNVMEVEHEERERINTAKIEETSGASFNVRQVGDFRSQGEHNIFKQKSDFHWEKAADEVQSSNSCWHPCPTQVNGVEEGQTKMAVKLPNEASHNPAHTLVKPDNQCCEKLASVDNSLDAVCSSASTPSSPIVDSIPKPNVILSAASAEVVPAKNSAESNKGSKEFKLNSGAKVFSPSFVNPRSATPPAVPTVASTGYIPSNYTTVAVSVGQPENGITPFAPRPSAPSKFVQYGNFAAGNGGSGSHFSQSVVGHMGSRTQPLRYAAQYQPVQPGLAYVNPNSQAVMVGRMGQLVYVQPVSHDLVQGVGAISPLSARPLLAPQVQFPKHQGTTAGQALQLCVPQPFIANGQQPFAVPSHIPLLQPQFPANCLVPVPGSNGLFSNKFP